LFLTEKLLQAVGFEYDDIGETWLAPTVLLPVVTVECDDDRAYVMEVLLEAHAILESAGCTYRNYAINRRYVSIVGLTMAEVPALV